MIVNSRDKKAAGLRARLSDELSDETILEKTLFKVGNTTRDDGNT